MKWGLERDKNGSVMFRVERDKNGDPIRVMRGVLEEHGVYTPALLKLVRSLKGVGRPFRSLVRWKRAQ